MPLARALAAALLATGCFHPSLGDQPYACGQNEACPSGYTCQGNICVRDGLHPGPDARPGVDAPGGTPDARPVADAPNGTPDARPTADARVADSRPALDGHPAPDAPLPDAPACLGDGFVGCAGPMTATFCVGGQLQPQSCAFQCDPSAMLCEQCDPSRPTFCQGDSVVTCSPTGQIGPASLCPGFCAGGACHTLEPSNLPATTCDTPAQASLGIIAAMSIDTGTCSGGQIVVQTDGLTPLCVLTYADFGIAAGVLVTVTGPNPLAIVATHDLTIGGVIDASGHAAVNGPGVAASVGTGGSNDGNVANGGGGGGFGQAGGTGGTPSDGTVVAGGQPFGSPGLSPITGGAAGGHAGAGADVVNKPAPGGGGGGGVQLVACHVLHLAAPSRIIAVGAGGGGGYSSLLSGGGGGGGSGGGVLLEAPALDVGPGAAAVATGGGGGGGGAPTGAGQPGEPGAADHGALGGMGGSTDAGAGGHGATGTPVALAPGPGGAVTVVAVGGGGGGGGIGRIRVNTRRDVPVDGSGLIAIPPASGGGIASH
jgi:hypothetical protein